MLDFIGSWKECFNWLSDQPRDKKYRVVEYHPKRSRNASAYFHVLCDRIADARTLRGDAITKAAQKNELIGMYGQRWRDSDGEPLVVKTNIKPEVVKEWEEQHLYYFKTGEDGANWYLLMKHTSDLDSRQMSALIDGTQEVAKEWGVEILTPDELARLEGYEKQAH